MELEAPHAVVGDQPLCLVDAPAALVRVDARERDQHVGVRLRDRGDLLVRDPGLARRRLGVDGEDDGHHVPLAVERGQLLRGRARRLAPEVLDRGVAQVVGERVVAGAGHLGVRVDVDRDDVVEHQRPRHGYAGTSR